MSDPHAGTAWTPGSYASFSSESDDEVRAAAEQAAAESGAPIAQEPVSAAPADAPLARAPLASTLPAEEMLPLPEPVKPAPPPEPLPAPIRAPIRAKAVAAPSQSEAPPAPAAVTLPPAAAALPPVARQTPLTPRVKPSSAAITSQPAAPSKAVTPPAEATPPPVPITPPPAARPAAAAPPPVPITPPPAARPAAAAPAPAPITSPPASTYTPPPVRPLTPAPPPAIPAAVRAAPPSTAGGSRLEVVNREGWRKEFPLQRSLAYVGSQPNSQIYLPVAEVAARHIQFVPSPVNRAGYRLINISSAPLTLRVSGGAVRSVAPNAAAELSDGDSVELAGYTILYRSGEVQSAAIQARIEMAGSRLELNQPLDGAIYIRNTGDKAGVQFDVQAQGFDLRSIQLEPGPVLFPGAEKRVAFRITHPHQAAPPAGNYALTLVVTAPENYPGESAVVTAAFTVAEYYAHTVRFVAVAPAMSGYTLA